MPVIHACRGRLTSALHFIILCAAVAAVPAVPASAAPAGDPLVSVQFCLQVEGTDCAYFTAVEGIGSEIEVVEHKALLGKGAQTVQKVPGRVKWLNVTFTRGLTTDLSLWEWHSLVEDGDVTNARKDFSIIMLDESFKPVAQWDFTRGWPSKIEGPVLQDDTGEFVIESMTIVHEGCQRVSVAATTTVPLSTTTTTGQTLSTTTAGPGTTTTTAPATTTTTTPGTVIKSLQKTLWQDTSGNYYEGFYNGGVYYSVDQTDFYGGSLLVKYTQKENSYTVSVSSALALLFGVKLTESGQYACSAENCTMDITGLLVYSTVQIPYQVQMNLINTNWSPPAAAKSLDALELIKNDGP